MVAGYHSVAENKKGASDACALLPDRSLRARYKMRGYIPSCSPESGAVSVILKQALRTLALQARAHEFLALIAGEFLFLGFLVAIAHLAVLRAHFLLRRRCRGFIRRLLLLGLRHGYAEQARYQCCHQFAHVCSSVLVIDNGTANCITPKPRVS